IGGAGAQRQSGEAVHGVGRDADDLAGDERLGRQVDALSHGVASAHPFILPTRARARPARSGRTDTSVKPASLARAAAASDWWGAISTTRAPGRASHAGASA